MAKKQKRKKDDPQQSRRFVETARDLEADRTGKAFEKLIEHLKDDADQNRANQEET